MHLIITGRRIISPILVYLLNIPPVIVIKMNNNGLTKIPSGISCEENILNFRRNSINRLEVDDFLCFTKVRVLDLSLNNITCIHDEAFFPLVSMRRLRLTHNIFLGYLPAYLGPFVTTMRSLRMNNIGLEYLPRTFFQQFHTLRELRVAKWRLENPDEDLFHGLINTEVLQVTALTTLPNLTNRVPALRKLKVSGLVDGNIMESSIRHLANLTELFIEAPCDNIRLLTFEGANMLTTYDASACAMREIPDVIHLTSLTRFETDMSRFECNTLVCWMLFEDLSNTVFSWLKEATCKAPADLMGVFIRKLSPVQRGCFKGNGNMQ